MVETLLWIFGASQVTRAPGPPMLCALCLAMTFAPSLTLPRIAGEGTGRGQGKKRGLGQNPRQQKQQKQKQKQKQKRERGLG